ncbi:MAG: FtsW/RodA/SpoVE family cell cycle protein, partial [Gemmatimonadota bacterium]
MKNGRLLWLGDPALVGAAILLSLVGVAMIWSAGQLDVPSAVTGIWKRQALWLAIAAAVFLVVSHVPLRWVEGGSTVIYGVSIGLLILVLAVGSGPGTASWLRLGSFSLQPAEVAKFGTLLMLARVLSGRAEPETRLSRLWRPLLLTVVPFGLVLLQPDLGSALVFGPVLLAMCFAAGAPTRSLLWLLVLAAAGAVAAYFVLHD